jgi:hypothetical protein
MHSNFKYQPRAITLIRKGLVASIFNSNEDR